MAELTSERPMTEEEWLKPWEYRCIVCGYEYRSLKSLLSHIEQAPHWLTFEQYGTLNRAALVAPGREESGGD